MGTDDHHSRRTSRRRPGAAKNQRHPHKTWTLDGASQGFIQTGDQAGNVGFADSSPSGTASAGQPS